MSVTYDALLNDTQTIQYIAGASNTSLYPDSNTIAITGPIWLPRIYGKDLTAFEIASSGKIAISLNDIHTVDITRSNYVDTSNFKNTIVSQSNYSLDLVANAGDLQVLLDAYSNNIIVSAASNVNISASSGNMSFTTSNDTTFSTSNNFGLVAKSNVSLYAAKGAATIAAHNSNMQLTMADTTNTVTLYSSNETYVSACNNFFVNTNSNVEVGALGGDVKVYANSSNMYLTMDHLVNNVTVYASNDLFLSASNSLNVNAQSNVSIGALGGDFKAYADSSNVYVTLERATDNATLYALNNVYISASNDYNLNANSNIFVGALAGDVKVYSQGSNMYLTMAAATNSVDLFASNNFSVSVSNNMNTAVNSNISISTVAGDYRLYTNSSNMFYRMSATTNTINMFASNNIIESASNSFNVFAKSNVTFTTVNGSVSIAANSSNMYQTMDAVTNNTSVFTSNNYTVAASNDLVLEAQSNVGVNAVAGAVKVYAENSNISLVLDNTTDNATLYALSNIYVSASNDFNLNAKNNVYVGALDGDVKVYAKGSNMFLTMDSVTNTVAAFASNNFNVSVSNSLTAITLSNIAVSANRGDLKLYANQSNMFITMDRATNNTAIYTSNLLTVSTSNSASVTAVADVTIAANTGDVGIYAASSNLSLVMDNGTLNMTQFASNDVAVTSCNTYTLNAQSNIYIGALGGDFKAYANASNMYLTMEVGTDNTTVYTSNDMYLSASNSFNLNANSNIYIGALAGDFKAYADGSNMYLTMDKATDDVALCAANNISISSSNTYFLNAKSNIFVGALEGSLKLYANSSNTSIVLDQPTSNIVVFASNQFNASACNSMTFNAKSNITINAIVHNISMTASNDVIVTASNSYILNAKSNISLNASKGSWNAYANDSNMFLTMDHTTNNVALYGQQSMYLTASNDYVLNVQSNVRINAAAGSFDAFAASNYFMAADNSNMMITMDAPTDVVKIYSLSNIEASACNNLFLNAASNINVTSSNLDILAHRDIYLTASNDIIISASNQLVFHFGGTNVGMTLSENQTITAQSNIDFYILSASNPTDPMFSVRNTDVLIRGDVVITGSINTSNVFSTTVIQESLKIQDLVMTLASVGSNYSPGDGPTDGIANSGAGLVIDGVPSGYDSNVPQAYDKTFKWNYGNTGIAGLGTSAGLSNESFWEIKGGSFHMTHQKIVPSGGSNVVRDVTMIMRINENDELEICKKWWYTASNNYVVKRVAKFGKIL